VLASNHLLASGRGAAIDRCASSGEAQLLAAVGRLYPAPGQVLELRTLPPDSRECLREGAASHDVGFLETEEYLKTDEFGRGMIP
jgi:hypothetical protein